MLADFCQLYNAALQQRIEAYRRRRISLQYGNQIAHRRRSSVVHRINANTP